MNFYDLLTKMAQQSLKDLMPLGIPKRKLLDDDPDHEFLLFTGQLYQITPYMESLREFYEKGEDYSDKFYKIYDIMGRAVWSLIKPTDIERYDAIVKKIYDVLKKKIDIGYENSIDFYSGIIFHDLGMPEFEEYARKLMQKLNNRKLVTIDPHTTYALKVLYREIDKNFSADVHHYSEFLNSMDLQDFADHESCYLNRYLDIKINVNAVKPLRNGKESGCCGGPIEFISPRLARAIAESRMRELLETGKNNVLVYCPVCLSNLSRLKMARVFDFIEVYRE